MTTYSAVVTTGIYCRPGCRARPLADNVRTFELAAAAEAAGFRACLRCRPYRTVGSAPWQAPEFVCRAVQLIIAGALDDGTEADLADRLGMSSRHLRRLFLQHLGATPDQLARSRRAHFARRLLDDTDLSIVDIAFASGFGSLRQFNRRMRETFRLSPRQLRERRHRADRLAADGGLTLRLPFTPPYDWDAALALLASRAIPGVEVVDAGVYRRTIVLDGEPGLLEIWSGGTDHLLLRAHLPYWEGLIHVVERVRRMVGLDTDLASATSQLTADPLIGPLVRHRPGLPVLGTWAPFEAGVLLIAQQNHRHSEALSHVAALVGNHGPRVPGLAPGLTHAFPAPATVAVADLDSSGLSPTAARTVRHFARALVSGDIRLDGSASLDDLTAALTTIPGFSVTTAQHLALSLGEHDAFPRDDPSVRTTLQRLCDQHTDPATIDKDLTAIDESWRPWRSVAATHLREGDKPCRTGGPPR